MNKIVNRLLLTGDKCVPEIHLNNLDLLTVLVEHLLQTKKPIKNLKKQEMQIIFTKMNFIRPVSNTIWPRDFKDLKRRTASDKVVRDTAFNIAKYPKHFDKKSTGSGVSTFANKFAVDSNKIRSNKIYN